MNNTVRKFFKNDEELVKKLSFYNIDQINNETNIFFLKPITGLSNIKEEALIVKQKKATELRKYHINSPATVDEKLPLVLTTSLSIIEDKKSPKKKSVRLENTAIEAKLNYKKKQLESKLSEINEYLTDTIKNLNIIQKNLESETTDLTLLKAYYENSKKEFEGGGPESLTNKDSNTNTLLSIDSVNRKKSRKNFFDPNVQLECLKQLKRIEDKVKREEQEITFRIEELKEMRVKFKERKGILETKQQKYSSELKDIKNQLLLHYHKVLNEGIDTRQKGLMWVIKEIYLLGFEVLPSYLPQFLDEQAITYLFKVK